MDLILLRHGKSPPLTEAGVSTDEERPLSDLGLKQAKRAGKALAAMDLHPKMILTSPLVRARQTAERAAEGLGGETPVKVFEVLAAGADPEDIIEALASFDGKSPLVLVGHQPDLGALASRLVFGSETSSIGIKPGGMVLIELEDLATCVAPRLRWVLLPTQIEEIA